MVQHRRTREVERANAASRHYSLHIGSGYTNNTTRFARSGNHVNP